MKHLQLLFILMGLMITVPQDAIAQKGNLQKGDYGFLYCHMNERGRAWTAYALSRDGFHYHDLLDGDSIFSDAELPEEDITDGADDNTGGTTPQTPSGDLEE